MAKNAPMDGLLTYVTFLPKVLIVRGNYTELSFMGIFHTHKFFFMRFSLR